MCVCVCLCVCMCLCVCVCVCVCVCLSVNAFLSGWVGMRSNQGSKKDSEDRHLISSA